MFFQKNLPSWERALRVLTGLAAAIGAFALPIDPRYQWLAAAGGAMFAATGFVGFCPMCALFGRRPKPHGR